MDLRIGQIGHGLGQWRSKGALRAAGPGRHLFWGARFAGKEFESSSFLLLFLIEFLKVLKA